MLWLVPIIPALGCLLIFPAVARSRTALGLVSCSALIATLLLAGLAASADWSASLRWSETLVLTAGLVPASGIVAILVPIIALPILAYASAHEAQHGLARLIALLLLFVAGMEVLVVSADFLTLLIGWEIVGACSWALIGHHWRDAENIASGRYAFVTTRFGDLGLFVAAIAVFAGSGSFAFESIASLPTPLLQIVVVGVLLSAAAKSGQVPFSPWLFRAMAGPTSVSALLHAATMVAAGAFLLIRLHPYLSAVPAFSGLAVMVGLATALAGGVTAILQPHAKKLLAASTSAHYGLMFVAVGAGYPGVALLHLVAHSAFKALLFLSAGIAGERAGSYLLTDIGFGRTLLGTGFLTLVGTLSLAGLPPLGGGLSKELVIAAGEHAGPWVGIAAMVAGAFSAAYATRFQLQAFRFRDGEWGSGFPSKWEVAAVAVLAFLSIALGLLWLPGLRSAAANLAGMEVPEVSIDSLLWSLGLAGLGILGGVVLARRWPRLGLSDTQARAAEWLGLPDAVATLVVKPVQTAAYTAAKLDDLVLDAPARGVGCLGIVAAGYFSSILEMLSNTLPTGSAWLVGMGGSDSRRLQTGLSHHYYAFMAAGALVTILVLVIVG